MKRSSPSSLRIKENRPVLVEREGAWDNEDGSDEGRSESPEVPDALRR